MEFTRTLVQIEAMVAWQIVRAPDGTWLGVCRALNLNAAGDTWGEFQECANEAIDLLFRDLFKTGELDAFLARNHWRSTTA